jgi:3-hydroxybutyryl-CoA dehydrogenase
MPNPSTVGVAGLGLLGRGIATCLLAHGYRVIACEPKAEARDAAVGHIGAAIDDLVQRGGFPARLSEEWRGRYVTCEDVAAFADCEFVIESIVEELSAKHALFDRIEAVLGPTVPIASNTSALPISSLQAARKHPPRFIGAHWAEPCHLTRFLEVVRGEQTDDATVEATLALGRRVGKDPTVVRKDVEGFIVNRLGYAMFREAFWLLENGVADVDTIDRAFRNALSVWANVAGPFRWMDLTGIPAYAAVMERLFPQLSKSDQVPEAMRRLVEGGAVGIANGRGFYDYTPEEVARWRATLVENVWRVRAMQAELLPEGRR